MISANQCMLQSPLSERLHRSHRSLRGESRKVSISCCKQKSHRGYWSAVCDAGRLYTEKTNNCGHSIYVGLSERDSLHSTLFPKRTWSDLLAWDVNKCSIRSCQQTGQKQVCPLVITRLPKQKSTKNYDRLILERCLSVPQQCLLIMSQYITIHRVSVRIGLLGNLCCLNEALDSAFIMVIPIMIY